MFTKNINIGHNMDDNFYQWNKILIIKMYFIPFITHSNEIDRNGKFNFHLNEFRSKLFWFMSRVPRFRSCDVTESRILRPVYLTWTRIPTITLCSLLMEIMKALESTVINEAFDYMTIFTHIRWYVAQTYYSVHTCMSYL